MKDEIFKEPIKKQFEFDASVASVFDDMIGRSVPYYAASQKLIADFLAQILPQNSSAIDLGCSPASTLLALWRKRNDLALKGVDNAPAMLQNARAKIEAYGARIELELADILECKFDARDAVLMNYTLQFIRPPKRQDFVAKIYRALNDGGVFVFSEKLLFVVKTRSKKNTSSSRATHATRSLKNARR